MSSVRILLRVCMAFVLFGTSLAAHAVRYYAFDGSFQGSSPQDVCQAWYDGKVVPNPAYGDPRPSLSSATDQACRLDSGQMVGVWTGTCPSGESKSFEFWVGQSVNGNQDITNLPPTELSFDGCLYQRLPADGGAVTGCHTFPDSAKPYALFCTVNYKSNGQDGSAADSQLPCQDLGCAPGYTPPGGGGDGGGGGDDGGGGGDDGGGGGGGPGGGVPNTCPNGATNYPLCTTGGTTGGGGGTDPPSGAIGGSCENVGCSGDAIQCFIAREVSMANCYTKRAEDAAKATAAFAVGDAAMQGADPLGGALPTKTNGDSWAMPTSLQAAGWLGGGSCFQDKHFSMQGRTFTIPFSQACEYLLALRFAIMVVATWISFRMISGVILRD